MARAMVAASVQVASFAARQPRVAVGGIGLGGILLIEAIASMLVGYMNF
ncbi:hypothetical protein BH10PSE14_BH10PSE14_02520 [soil metagenome]